jgi:hypothetical protein
MRGLSAHSYLTYRDLPDLLPTLRRLLGAAARLSGRSSLDLTRLTSIYHRLRRLTAFRPARPAVMRRAIHPRPWLYHSADKRARRAGIIGLSARHLAARHLLQTISMGYIRSGRNLARRPEFSPQPNKLVKGLRTYYF